MSTPFQRGLADFQAGMAAFQAPQMRQLQMLQAQAEIQRSLGQDPLTQQKIAESQQRMDISRQEADAGIAQRERDEKMVFGALAKAALDMPEAQRDMFINSVSSMMGVEIPAEMRSEEALSGVAKVFAMMQEPEQARAQKIYGDGTVVQSTDKGVRVFDASGNKLEGEEATVAIDKARKSDAEQKRRESIATATGTQSIEISKAAFDKLPEIGKNISNLDRAKELIEDGEAGVGPIMSLLPSFRDASIELDNLANQLGLDVVSMTTFGALSEGELKLAINTALPTNLRGQKLVDWIDRKKVAQTKLYDELQRVASFFGQGGNIAEYMEQMKSRKAEGKSSIQKEIDALREELL